MRTVPFGGSIEGLHFDTLKDLFDDTVGGAIAAAWYYWSRLRRSELRNLVWLSEAK
jgi:hypothetical protein